MKGFQMSWGVEMVATDALLPHHVDNRLLAVVDGPEANEDSLHCRIQLQLSGITGFQEKLHSRSFWTPGWDLLGIPGMPSIAQNDVDQCCLGDGNLVENLLPRTVLPHISLAICICH